MKLFAMFFMLASMLLAIANPAAAQLGIQILDPFARIINGSGVVYFMIDNVGPADDILLSATSPVASMVHLMNSGDDENGVMHMETVDEGFAIAAGTERGLARGADHIMLMGISQSVATGEEITLVLTFKVAGDLVVTVPVDNKRRADPGRGPTPYDVQSGKDGSE